MEPFSVIEADQKCASPSWEEAAGAGAGTAKSSMDCRDLGEEGFRGVHFGARGGDLMAGHRVSHGTRSRDGQNVLPSRTRDKSHRHGRPAGRASTRQAGAGRAPSPDDWSTSQVPACSLRYGRAAAFPSAVSLWITMCIADVHRPIRLWITLWTGRVDDWPRGRWTAAESRQSGGGRSGWPPDDAQDALSQRKPCRADPGCDALNSAQSADIGHYACL